MMDSKQLALVYLMEEANRMSSVCTKNVHSLDKRKAKKQLEEQLGKLFSAMREVGEEFDIDEDSTMVHAEKEYLRRLEEK